MRSNIRKIPHPLIGGATTSASIPAALSTSGGGWGRGGHTPFIFTVDSSTQTDADTPKDDSPSPLGHGRGRGSGKPLHSPPILPSFPSFVNNEAGPAAICRGRGVGFIPTKTIPPQQRPPPNPNAKNPCLFAEDDAHRDSTDSESPVRHEKILPSEIVNILSGAGRGKPTKPEAAHALKPKTENLHVRPQHPTKPKSSAEELLTQEEKVKKAVGILSKGDGESMRGSDGIRGGRGRLGPRGGRGRGRGRGRGGFFGRGSGRERREDKFEDSNLLIECEPVNLMEEFGTNPDIDEKPTIPLRDALEKMKPFLMAYKGIQSREEWEEVMEETMKTVPLMKEIVDHYCGPNRVTAKQLQEELERVAKTLPASAPASGKRFTEHADLFSQLKSLLIQDRVLSLQSYPGLGFDEKCQLMDELIMEVSGQHKDSKSRRVGGKKRFTGFKVKKSGRTKLNLGKFEGFGCF